MKKKGLIISILVIVLFGGMYILSRPMQRDENLLGIKSKFILQDAETEELGEKLYIANITAPGPEQALNIKKEIIEKAKDKYDRIIIRQDKDEFVYKKTATGKIIPWHYEVEDESKYDMEGMLE